MKKVDMSEKAVTMRLRQVDQLRHLCLSLIKTKKEHGLQGVSDTEMATDQKDLASIFGTDKKDNENNY